MCLYEPDTFIHMYLAIHIGIGAYSRKQHTYSHTLNTHLVSILSACFLFTNPSKLFYVLKREKKKNKIVHGLSTEKENERLRQARVQRMFQCVQCTNSV